MSDATCCLKSYDEIPIERIFIISSILKSSINLNFLSLPKIIVLLFDWDKYSGIPYAVEISDRLWLDSSLGQAEQQFKGCDRTIGSLLAE